jgi:hypothetical protein
LYAALREHGVCVLCTVSDRNEVDVCYKWELFVPATPPVWETAVEEEEETLTAPMIFVHGYAYVLVVKQSDIDGAEDSEQLEEDDEGYDDEGDYVVSLLKSGLLGADILREVVSELEEQADSSLFYHTDVECVYRGIVFTVQDVDGVAAFRFIREIS